MTGTAVQPLIPTTTRIIRETSRTEHRTQSSPPTNGGKKRQHGAPTVAATDAIARAINKNNKNNSNINTDDCDDDDEMMRVQRTISTESEEPWDQRDKMREGYEEELEDGELPSLTTRHNNTNHTNNPNPLANGGVGRVVNGQRTTTRPLSPPSQAGLGIPADQAVKNRRFWGQFEGDDVDEEEPGMHQHPYSPGVPHDESPMPRGGGRRAPHSSSDRGTSGGRGGPGRGGSKVRYRDEYYDDESKSVGSYSRTQYSVESYDHADDAEDTFCGQALDAIGDMCGANLGLSIANPPQPEKIKDNQRHHNNDSISKHSGHQQKKVQHNHKDAKLPVKIADPPSVAADTMTDEEPILSPISPLSPRSPTKSMPLDADDVDSEQEHTAIEVEFVEPPAPKPEVAKNPTESSDRKKKDLDPKRKNAFLNAMAQKAKEEYAKNGYQQDGDHNEQEVVGGGGGGSGGSTDSSDPYHPTPDTGVYTNFNAAEKRKFLKLINSGMSPSLATEQVVKESNKGEQAVSHKKPTRAAKLAFWKKINPPSSDPSRNVEKSQPPQPLLPSLRDTKPSSRLQESSKPTSQRKGLALQITNDEEDNFERVLEDGVPGEDDYDPSHVLGKKANDVDVTHPESDESSDAAERVDGFAKSGINYYDAVRKDEPSDDEFSDEEFPDVVSPKRGQQNPSSVRSSSRLGSGRRGPAGLLSRGFAILDEKRSRSTPRASRHSPVETGSPDGRPFSTAGAVDRDDFVRDLESPVAGTLAITGARERVQQSTPVEEGQAKSEPEEDAEHATPEFTDEAAAIKSLPANKKEEEKKEQEYVSQRKTVQSLMKDNRSVASSSTDDAESISRIEKNLLRPIPKEEPNYHPAAGTPHGTQQSGPESAAQAPKLEARRLNDAMPHPQTPASLRSLSPNGESKGGSREMPEVASAQADKLDVSIHAYFSSTESYAGATGCMHDNASVYTSGTTYTQSTRVRRPGAAKERLAQAKRVNAPPSKKGWHESIRAVAASANRVWDPVRGWVDYKDRDPNDAFVADIDEIADTSQERLQINLENALIKRNVKSEEVVPETANETISVGFPPDWEKDREQMLNSEVKTSNLGEEERLDRLDEIFEENQRSELDEKERRFANNDAASEYSEPSHIPAMPRQWVDSMRAAAASITEDTWDPDTGWKKAGRPQLSPNNSFDGIRDPRDLEEFQESPIVQGYDGSPNSMASDPLDQSQPYRSNPASRVDTNLNKWIQQTAKAPLVEQSVESSDRTLETGKDSEKYVQLGDNGSVRSFIKVEKSKPAASQTAFGSPFREEEDDALSGDDIAERDFRDSGSFPSFGMDGHKTASSVTKVVKEKVGKDEFNLFHHEEAKAGRRRRQSTSPDVEVTEEEQIEEHNVISTSSSESSGQKAMDASFIDSAVASSSSPYAKRVPRLQRSRRDTSPIKDRSPDALHLSQETPASIFQPRLDHETIVPITPDNHSHVGSKEQSSYLDAPVVGEDQIYQRGFTEVQESKSETRSEAKSDFSASSASSVKERLQQWENRARSPNGRFDKESPGRHGSFDRSSPRVSYRSSPRGSFEKAEVTPEWKAFLGKKVLAESEAAARQGKQAGQDTETEKSPVSKYSSPREVLNAVHNEEDDSLLELLGKVPNEARRNEEKNIVSEEKNAAPTFGVSDLSPIRAKEDEESDHNVSEAYGPDPADRGSFFKRLSECAAPVMASAQCAGSGPSQKVADGTSMPMAHLAFLRQNPHVKSANQSGSRFVPPSLCSRQDSVQDKEEVYDLDATSTRNRSHNMSNNLPKQTREDIADVKKLNSRPEAATSVLAPKPQTTGRETRGSASSVVSDDGFGAKTAYLEALAMKTAVSNPRRRSRSSSSNRSVTSTSTRSVVSFANKSITSNASSQHSEKWKAFLERKKLHSSASLSSPPINSNSQVNVSRAAEKYAAEKVEEMMTMMASRSEQKKNVSSMNNRQGNPVSSRTENDTRELDRRKAESVRAAEDLAAARVEAMMAALSNSNNYEEGEI